MKRFLDTLLVVILCEAVVLFVGSFVYGRRHKLIAAPGSILLEDGDASEELELDEA